MITETPSNGNVLKGAGGKCNITIVFLINFYCYNFHNMFLSKLENRKVLQVIIFNVGFFFRLSNLGSYNLVSKRKRRKQEFKNH